MPSSLYELTAQTTITSTQDLMAQPVAVPTNLPTDPTALLTTHTTFLQANGEYINRLSAKISLLESTQNSWLDYLQHLSATKKADEQAEYVTMAGNPKGLLHTIDQAHDALAKAQALQTAAESAVASLRQPPNVPLAPSPQPVNASIKLPKLSLISFDGDFANWPRFWSAFERSVDSKPLDPADKLTYLLGALTSSVKATVAGYTVRAENYAPVVEILKTTYGQPQLIKLQLRKQLRDLPASRGNHDLAGTILAIEQLMQQLEALSANLNEEFYEDLIEEKLPFWLRDEIYRQKADDTDWNVTKLRQFLRATTLRRAQAAGSAPNSSVPSPKPINNSQGRHPSFFRPPAAPRHDRRHSDFRPKFHDFKYADRKPPTSSAFACTENLPHTQHLGRFKKPETRPASSAKLFNARESKVKPCAPFHNNAEARRDNSSHKRDCSPARPAHPLNDCAFCGEKHFHNLCKNYATYRQRVARADDLKLCGKCLKAGHSTTDCTSKIRPCFYCQGNHLGALCHIKFANADVNVTRTALHTVIETSPSAPPTAPNAHAVNTAAQFYEDDVLLMCKEVEFRNPDKPLQRRQKVLLFLDSGSQRSYIDQKLADRLELPILAQSTIEIATFGTHVPQTVASKTVKGGLLLQSGKVKQLHLHTVNYLTQPLQLTGVDGNEFPETRKIDLHGRVWQKPGILIGMDYYWQFVLGTQETAPGLYIVDTIIGSILAGTAQLNPPNSKHFHTSQYAAFDLDSFWQLESLGIQDNAADDDDQIAYDLFRKSISRSSSGRYIVRWPWKTDSPSLSNNLGMCFGRLRSVLDRLKGSPQLLQKYDEVFREQLSNGVIELVPERPTGPLVHYLPHQPVLTPRKATTKLRVVFDASAKTSVGHSLNEQLYRGPVMLPALAGILLRFRTYQYVMVADVEKAFLQIELAEEDRDVTRFLWVHDITKPPLGANVATYRYCRVLFGVISSPFLLAAVINHHLQNDDSPFAQAMVENLYVDNVMIGSNDRTFAELAYAQAKEKFQQGFMNLREFTANDVAIRESIPMADRNLETQLSVLGLQWNLDEDDIHFRTLPWPDRSTTKRTILGFISSHFDPLGFLAPTILPLKQFCQSLWQRRCEWDAEISIYLQREWNKLKESWQALDFSIPRMAARQEDEITLHVFVDASNIAYAAAVYGRCELGNTISTELLFSKCKLMPINKLTIPKAELMAALIGTRALQFVRQQMRLENASVFAWSDSKCVIAWIKTDQLETLKPRFVQNRVREIQESDLIYRYVPSHDNPADLATRGLSPSGLQASDLWWHGPAWLQKDNKYWPQDLPPGITEPHTVNEEETELTPEITEGHTISEEKDAHPEVACSCQIACFPDCHQSFLDVTRFNKWSRLIGAAQTVLLFLKKIAKTRLPILRTIKDENDRIGAKHQAECLLIQQAQRSITADDISKWELKQDAQGTWLVYGRLANVPTSTQLPIFLPRNDSLTKLLILQVHEEQGHAGVAHTLANFRTRFWIDKGRQTTRKILQRECLHCRRWNAKQFQLPPMAPLPHERLARTTPFQNTAVDYAGPFTVRTAEGKSSKIWIGLFTCLVTRAVHLECTKSLSMAEFMNMFKRFTARRGCPQIIVSDNGTQFTSAARLIGADWRFITAHAPWKGGVYERLVGLMKKCLRQAIGRKILTEAEFTNLVIRTESILNSRPIVQVVDDSIDVLRPIDFLQPKVEWPVENLYSETGDDDYLPPECNLTAQGMRTLFQRTEECLDQFWKLWQTDYLHFLLEKSDRIHQQSRLLTRRCPQIGDVVLMYDENLPRGLWKLAKVVGFPDATDSTIRTATIRTSTKRLLQRPINHLYSLEISEADGPTPSKPIGDANLEPEALEEPAQSELIAVATNTPRTNAPMSRQYKTHNNSGGKPPSWFWTVALLALVFPSSALAIVAYDCSHRNLNITAIDITTVGGCEETHDLPETGEELIQLIQLMDEFPVTVRQCKVVISRHVTHCGMHSHGSEVLGGLATFIYEIGSSRCKEVHITGTLQLQGSLILRDLTVGKLHTRTIVLAGAISADGNCEGASFTDAFGSWNKVVVQGTVQIKLVSYSSMARTDTDQIKFRSAYSCTYSTGYCMDPEDGESIWELSPEQSCSRNKHIVLYEGLAKTLTSKSGHRQEKTTTYTVESGDKIFALRVTQPYQGCAFLMYMTEHPKLLIVPKQTHGFYFEMKPVPPGALDLLTYMNSKFVYIDKTIGKNLEELYHHLSYQRCLSEQKILQTQLALAMINPSEFAYSYTGQAGYTANTMGEVVYLIKCEPVEVSVRKTDRCYAELPVVFNNASMYMTPRARLLQLHGTEITCSVFLRPMYRLHQAWYALSPSLMPAETPSIIHPTRFMRYRYTSPAKLATGGIYDESEVEKLRNQIMYPSERTAMTNVLARGAAGQNPDMQGLSVGHMIDERVVEKLKSNLVSKVWGSFTLFGTVVSGILGLLVLAKMAKWAIDTVLHGKILYDLYGISVVLIGAMWDSITYYFVHRKTKVWIPKQKETGGDRCLESMEEERLPATAPVEEGRTGLISQEPTLKGMTLYPMPLLREEN